MSKWNPRNWFRPKPEPDPAPKETGKIFLKPGEKAPSSIPSGVQQVTVDPSKGVASTIPTGSISSVTRTGGGGGRSSGGSTLPSDHYEFVESQYGKEVADAERAYQQSQAQTTAVQVQDDKPKYAFEPVQPYRAPSGATIESSGPVFEGQIYSPGTVYQYQTDVVKHKGRDIPILTAPMIIGEDWSPRPLTAEEVTKYDLLVRSKGYEEKFLEEPPSKISRDIGEIKGRYETFASESFVGKPLGEYVSDKVPGTVGDVTGGFISGLVPSTKGEVLTTLATFGVGAGIGFGVKGATYGISKIPKVGTALAVGVKGATIGSGVYYGGGYALNIAGQVSSTDSNFERGEIIGGGVRTIGAGYTGYKTGSKLFDIGKGYYVTRGRSYIEIPQGEYPAAPTSKQLKMFQKNIYQELGAKPGAFHTTGEVFWKKGTITPQPGTSELPGLYGSTQISTPFARIEGSGKAPLQTIFKNIGQWFSPPKDPGVAYLQPTSFRYSPGVKTSTGYTWKYPAKVGTADVPGIKTEIEAIFRPDAGGYGITGQGYYTIIKGVRVPIDSFAYDPSIPFGGSPPVTTTKIFQPGRYTSYQPPTITDPSAGVTSYFSGVSQPSPSFVFSNIGSSSQSAVTSSILSPSIDSSSTPSYTPPTYRPSVRRGGSSTSSRVSSLIPSIAPTSTSQGVSSSSLLSSSKRSYLTPGSGISYSSIRTPPTFKPPKFELPQRGFGDFGARRTYKYFPSFGAIAKGIRGKGKAPKATTRFTGLETRPIYNGKRKKKKDLFKTFNFGGLFK